MGADLSGVRRQLRALAGQFAERMMGTGRAPRYAAVAALPEEARVGRNWLTLSAGAPPPTR